MVFVDDGSTDGSLALLHRMHDELTNVVVVHLRRNFGKATALQAGFLEANGEIVVTIDADLQDDPAEIPKLLAKLDEGFDLVSGWKTRRNDPLPRRVFSRIFNWATGVISGVRLHDVNCGLKAYRAEVAPRACGSTASSTASSRCSPPIRVPDRRDPRQPPRSSARRSRYGPERYLRGFFDLLSVTFMGRYRYRPLHLFGGIGLLMGAVGFIVLPYLTVLWFWGEGIGTAASHPGRAPRRRGHPVRLARAHLGAHHLAARGANRRARAHRADGRRRSPLVVPCESSTSGLRARLSA